MDTPILVSHFVCHSTPLSLPCQFLTMTNTKCPKMSQIPQKSNHKFIYKSPISSVLALPLLSISISMANKHRKTPTFQTQPTFLNIHTKTTQFWNQHKFHPKTHITFSYAMPILFHLQLQFETNVETHSNFLITNTKNFSNETHNFITQKITSRILPLCSSQINESHTIYEMHPTFFDKTHNFSTHTNLTPTNVTILIVSPTFYHISQNAHIL